ncbi:hypothetical protein ACFQBQ_12140 [Granulicella cerasi]|uniref:Uncharacterized protein n=1 Tax=Granulicella cerasi TaxID=741063 RepID=A0ABW1ZA62_9BACT|nr:hypothetical protein [Granulicella cerasi]
MDFAAIVLELDREISKLQAIREVVSGLASRKKFAVATRPERKRAPEAKRVEPTLLDSSEPKTVVVPAKMKRVYQPRPKKLAEPNALAAPRSAMPVFVPKAQLSVEKTAVELPAMNAEAFEHALRRHLLGAAV